MTETDSEKPEVEIPSRAGVIRSLRPGEIGAGADAFEDFANRFGGVLPIDDERQIEGMVAEIYAAIECERRRRDKLASAPSTYSSQ